MERTKAPPQLRRALGAEQGASPESGGWIRTHLIAQSRRLALVRELE
jgi:hypothetical protein